MRGGEAIIESLKRMGVNTIFGYPGGQTIPFYDMLYDADMDHILVRHEQCAAHAADGFARASGKVGVCLATSGPGATNLVTGIATAYMDSSPIIAITGQVPTHLIGNDAFQEADIIGITMPITKHSFQPKDPNLIPSIVKTSFEIAESGRPGPVLIDVPKEIQEGELDSFDDSLISTPGYNPTLKGNIKQVRKARDLIRESKKPIILAGAGVILANASQELKELSYLINAPVMTSLLGKGAIDETDDMALGMLGMHGRKVANDSINESDLIIAVGIRFSDRATGRLDSFAPNSKIIHIDIDPAEIGKNVDVDLPIVGDAKNVLSSLNNVLKDYMLRGYAVNQKRLEYLEKTVKLIDIANRMDERLEGNDAKEILRVIGDYSKALNLLDDYDHRTLEKVKGNIDERKIKYDDCIHVINQLRFNSESSIFAIERNRGLEAIIGNIYQSFGGQDIYKSIEEKGANFLYLIVKNHVFVDGNKRIAATLFIYFLNFYGILYKNGRQTIDNNTLAALTLLIAESNPKEKEIIIDLVMNFLKND